MKKVFTELKGIKGKLILGGVIILVVFVASINMWSVKSYVLSPSITDYGDDCGCDAVLVGGVYNYRAYKGDFSAEKEVKHFLAKASFDQFQRFMKTTAGGSYGVYGFNASFSKSEFEQHQNQLREEMRDWMKETKSEELLEKFGDEKVLNAWTTCKSSCRVDGLKSWIERQDGDNYRLNLYWNPPASAPNSVKIVNFRISGGTTDINPNERVIENKITKIIAFTRESINKPIRISLTIQNNENQRELDDIYEFIPKYIPEKEKPTPTPTPKPTPTPCIPEPTFDANKDTLYVSERLPMGSSLKSKNNHYELIMQRDGNLVLYKDGKSPALWSATTAADYAEMQTDGNFVVYKRQGDGWISVFATNTQPAPGAKLVLQNDGNLVLYRGDGTAAWQSNTKQPKNPAFCE